VIIGGGVAGAVLAKTIQHQATVTLIDPWDFSFAKTIYIMSLYSLIHAL
jgi:NADH dehydrogenase FAD-containing subunit